MSNPKYTRGKIPAAYVEKFERHKQRVERMARVKMSDSQFVTMMVCWALDESAESGPPSPQEPPIKETR